MGADRERNRHRRTCDVFTVVGNHDCQYSAFCHFLYRYRPDNRRTPGVAAVAIKAWGAGGGGVAGTAGCGQGLVSKGGGGGFAYGVLTVTSGQVLTLITGQGGADNTGSASVGGGGGGSYYGGSGGGRSQCASEVWKC